MEEFLEKIWIWATPISLTISLMFFIHKKNREYLEKEGYIESPKKVNPHTEGLYERETKRTDPNFEMDEFKKDAVKCFMVVQKSISNRRWEGIRMFEGDELFKKHDEMQQYLLNHNRFNVIEDIEINKVELLKHENDGLMERISLLLHVKMKDYIIDDQTLELLEGDKNAIKERTYEMQFRRHCGVTTKYGRSIFESVCPKCGTLASVTFEGHCEHCAAKVSDGQYSWILDHLIEV